MLIISFVGNLVFHQPIYLNDCLPAWLIFLPICLQASLFACLLVWLSAVNGCIAKLANGDVLCGLLWCWPVCAKARYQPVAHRKAARDLP